MPVGKGEDRVHVVLDQDDREAPAQSPRSRCDEGLGLLAAGARERLVEQEKLRLGRERAGQLQPPVLAVASALAARARRGPRARHRGARASRPVIQRLLARRRCRRSGSSSPSRACTASATFSSTVKRGRIEVIWKVRARPRCTRSAIDRLGDVPPVERDRARCRARLARRAARSASSCRRRSGR